LSTPSCKTKPCMSLTTTRSRSRSSTATSAHSTPLAGADRDDPLRQLEACGDPGRVGSGTVRAPQVRGAALALRCDSFFCAPGLDGVHEKGGVEGEIGRFRRRHLTPVPHVGSLAALNKALAAADARDDTAGSAPGSRPSARPPPAQLSVGCPGGQDGRDAGGHRRRFHACRTPVLGFKAQDHVDRPVGSAVPSNSAMTRWPRCASRCPNVVRNAEADAGDVY
jgi:hypothetical protein